MTQPNFRRYDEVRPCIENADLLLFRRAGLTGAVIGAASRSIYSHAAMAAWWVDTLFCLEMRERIGGTFQVRGAHVPVGVETGSARGGAGGRCLGFPA